MSKAAKNPTVKVDPLLLRVVAAVLRKLADLLDAAAAGKPIP
jgi:hypothetical protein